MRSAAVSSTRLRLKSGVPGLSRYRQTGGRMPEGDPELIIEDLNSDGVDVG